MLHLSSGAQVLTDRDNCTLLNSCLQLKQAAGCSQGGVVEEHGRKCQLSCRVFVW
jgi:hypothetical protein